MRPEVCVDQLQDAIVVFLFDSHQFIVSVFNPFFIEVWAGRKQPLGGWSELHLPHILLVLMSVLRVGLTTL